MLTTQMLENLDTLAKEMEAIVSSSSIKQAQDMEELIMNYIETRTPEQLANLLFLLTALIDMLSSSSINNKVTGIATARLIKVIVDENLSDQNMSLIKAGLYTLVNPLSDAKNVKSNILYN